MVRLTIDKFDGVPARRRSIRENGDAEERLSSYSKGCIDIDGRLLEFDKYFVTNRTQKKRTDFVIFRERPAPDLTEQFARMNRAFFIGERAVRLSSVVLGAALNEKNDDTHSADHVYSVESPFELADLSSDPEFAISEEGDGFHWMRLDNHAFTVWLENPSYKFADFGVTMGVQSPNVASPNLHHQSWDYVDALLSPSSEELPGFLGNIALRDAIWQLKPGDIGTIYEQ